MSKDSTGNFTQNDFKQALEKGDLELIKECLRAYSGDFSFDNSDGSLDDRTSQTCQRRPKEHDPLKPLEFTISVWGNKQKSAEVADLLLQNGAKITEGMKMFNANLKFMTNYAEGHEGIPVERYLPLIKVFAFHSDVVNKSFDFGVSRDQGRLISDAIYEAKQLRRNFDYSSRKIPEELGSSDAGEVLGKDLMGIIREYSAVNTSYFEAIKQPQTSTASVDLKHMMSSTINKGCVIS